MDHECPKCWASPSTPLFCEQCDHLIEPKADLSPFEALGVDAHYRLNPMDLRKRLLGLSRRMHPDFYAGHPEAVRELAERNTAEINTAFEILADDFRRADWIVRSLGGPTEEDERQMPQEFLLEVLEWNETIEEASDAEPGSPERAALDDLEKELVVERKSLMDRISGLLTPIPEAGCDTLRDTRKLLNAVRYLNKSLHEIAELRLSESARP